MKRLFQQQVDVILEDIELFEPVSDAFRTVQDAKMATREAENTLAQEVDALHNCLALEIRRASPALNVTMGRDGHCRVCYKNYNNILSLCADPENECFTVGDSPFERRFRRYHGHCLNCEPRVLGKAVGDFFRQNYRSLR